MLEAVRQEQERQDAKWGQQDHPNGTGENWRPQADAAREACACAFASGEGSWLFILLEEVAEAFAEEDETRLEEELLQVAAVAVQWVEAIRRARNGGGQ